MARVAVLVSGGVDSAAAALLLKAEGHDLMGVTALMQPFSPKDDIYRAQRICHKLGMPHIVVDMQEAFARHVRDAFLRAYMAGTTPNPCAHCNREIKLGALLRHVLACGFERVATGHYAAVGEVGGRPVLREPADGRKSQVYFLALVRPAVLEHLDLPLADLTKAEARQAVGEAGLPAREGESQDLCFVARGRYRDLIEEAAGGPQPGEVVDRHGSIVGTHRGHYAYTVGQRFGIRGRRYYVVEKQASANRIVIAPRDEVYSSEIAVQRINSFVPVDWLGGRDLKIEYRYNSPAVPARLVDSRKDTLVFRTQTPCFAPAPGQILACYWKQFLVCGGVMTEVR